MLIGFKGKGKRERKAGELYIELSKGRFSVSVPHFPLHFLYSRPFFLDLLLLPLSFFVYLKVQCYFLCEIFYFLSILYSILSHTKKIALNLFHHDYTTQDRNIIGR